MEPSYSLASQAESTDPLRPGPLSQVQLFKQVQNLYVKQFRQWFAITAPTSVLAAVVLILADQQVRAIYRTIPKWTELEHPVQVAEMFAFRYGGFFVAWLFGCFALRGVATVVSGLDDDEDGFAIRDSHQRSRERFGALFFIALVTFVTFLLRMAAEGMVVRAIIKIVGLPRFSRFDFAVELSGTGVVASIVSWLGMAIPLVVRNEINVWAALKKSFEAADGVQGFLLLLIVESIFGSYLAWFASQYVILLLSPASVKYSAWFGWAMLLILTLISAAVEPPLFIGFSVLAERACLEASSFPRA